ncbi:MAG: SMI1/KNR4 family protein [Polyangiaceae bacterium]|nr:SMI1/KNR4 family protein [Polyangiaceae bacterium]
MSKAIGVRAAFEALREALRATFPGLVGELRDPVPFYVDWQDRPGAEDLLTLWSLTSGQADGMLGICGGLRLLGPDDSEAEHAKWRKLLQGPGIDAVAHPVWDDSQSLNPDAVRGVYFAAGWIPVLCEPLEANYLAVDLVPLPGGRPGQIILCGRDEDYKIVVAPDLATVLYALAAECRAGAWEIETTQTATGPQRYLERCGGRLLSACLNRTFPPPRGAL